MMHDKDGLFFMIGTTDTHIFGFMIVHGLV